MIPRLAPRTETSERTDHGPPVPGWVAWVASLALAAGAGLALYASHAPLEWWPASFLVVPALLAAAHVSRPTGPGPAVLGLVAGLAAYGPMISWLVLPAGVLGWSLLVLVQAAYLAVAVLLLARWLGRWQLALVAPLVWVGVDAIRAVFPLSGFSWGEIAYAHVDGSWLLPLARLLGGRGITMVVVLLGVLAFEAVRRGWRASGDAEARFAAARGPLVALVVVLLLSTVAVVDPPAGTGGTADVMIVQGNDIESPTATAYEVDIRVAEQMLALTRDSLAEGPVPDLVLWPEYSIDLDPRRDPTLGRIVAEAGALADGRLAVGIRRRLSTQTFTNTIAAVDPEGNVVDGYDKRRPVPFGEYVPARPLLDWFPPLEQVPTDAVAGPGPEQLRVADLPLAIAICFETLFPDLIRSNLLAGQTPAQLVVAATSDASFGRSAEPEQHLAQSQLRAVETGRWVAHGSLSGSSAFVDPRGRVHDATPLFEQATIRREVTLTGGLTPYLRLGDVPGRVGSVATVLLLALAALERLRTRRGSSRHPPSESLEP